jgi:hypothetical protein
MAKKLLATLIATSLLIAASARAAMVVDQQHLIDAPAIVPIEMPAQIEQVFSVGAGVTSLTRLDLQLARTASTSTNLTVKLYRTVNVISSSVISPIATDPIYSNFGVVSLDWSVSPIITNPGETLYFRIFNSAGSQPGMCTEWCYASSGATSGIGFATYTGIADPVPLPAAAWLLLSGLGGLGALARRRKA